MKSSRERGTMRTRSLQWDTCGHSEETAWWEPEINLWLRSGVVSHHNNNKTLFNNADEKQILSLWAEISLELLPRSENTREWDKNMETDLSGLSFMPCAVTRKTEWISTPLLWICFKEENNCKLLTQFLIISKKNHAQNSRFPSSVVRFTGKPWYLADSLKTLYLKCVTEKHSTWNAWRRLCSYAELFGRTLPVPKNWCSQINGISMYLYAHVWCP